MGTDPNEERKNETGHEEDEHPGSVNDPGNVTVDEPTDPALSGTADDDFADGDRSEE